MPGPGPQLRSGATSPRPLSQPQSATLRGSSGRAGGSPPGAAGCRSPKPGEAWSPARGACCSWPAICTTMCGCRANRCAARWRSARTRGSQKRRRHNGAAGVVGRPPARLAATFPAARHGVLQRMGGPVMLTIAKGTKMQIRRVVAGTGADGQAVILSDGFAPHGQRRAISAPGRPGPISPGQAEPSGCAVLRHDRGLVAPQRCRRAV